MTTARAKPMTIHKITTLRANPYRVGETISKMTIVKAKPAKKVVKAFPAAALKASI